MNDQERIEWMMDKFRERLNKKIDQEIYILKENLKWKLKEQGEIKNETK
jgi:hypothetical protein